MIGLISFAGFIGCGCQRVRLLLQALHFQACLLAAFLISVCGLKIGCTHLFQLLSIFAAIHGRLLTEQDRLQRLTLILALKIFEVCLVFAGNCAPLLQRFAEFTAIGGNVGPHTLVVDFVITGAHSRLDIFLKALQGALQAFRGLCLLFHLPGIQLIKFAENDLNGICTAQRTFGDCVIDSADRSVLRIGKPLEHGKASLHERI